MSERINKQKAAQFVRGLENANPTADAFQRIKNMVQGKPLESSIKPRDDMYMPQSGERSNETQSFSPDSYKTFSDTNLDRQKADAVLKKLRGEQFQQPAPTPSVRGDIQALMDQQQDLEQRQEFEPLDQDDMQKLQRIKEMLLRNK